MAPRCLGFLWYYLSSSIQGIVPIAWHNKKSNRVKKILALASALGNRWLFSSRFLICLTQNISKQIRVIDTYKRKNLPQNQWRNLLRNVRIVAWSTVYSSCVILVTSACTVFAERAYSVTVGLHGILRTGFSFPIWCRLYIRAVSNEWQETRSVPVHHRFLK